MKKKEMKMSNQLSLEFEVHKNIVKKSINMPETKSQNILKFPTVSSSQSSFREKVIADLIKNKIIMS